MANLLHRLGCLETGQLVHAMRDDLVAEFAGQTAPKTKRVLERAMGGVLSSRIAHRLASDPHRSWTRDDLMRLEAAGIIQATEGSEEGDLGYSVPSSG